MVFKQVYEVTDKPYDEVRKGWTVSHIFLYLVAATTGIASSYVFGILREEFGDNCILYPHLNFSDTGANSVSDHRLIPIVNQTIIIANSTTTDAPMPTSKINERLTKWGDDTLCDFCQYMPVMSMIFGTVFITFFIMCPRGGTRNSQSGIRQPWHIVLPAMILTGIFAIIITISSRILVTGLEAFCAEFKDELNTTKCGAGIDQYALKDTEFQNRPSIRLNYLPKIIIICVCSWFLAFATLLCRCCCVADFKIIERTFQSIDREGHRIHLQETEVLLDPGEGTSSALPVSQV